MNESNFPGMADARRLAQRLQHALNEIREREAYPLCSETNRIRRPLPDTVVIEEIRPAPQIEELVAGLNELLKANGFKPDLSAIRLPPDEFWTFGSVDHSLPPREIHLGYIEPIIPIPIVRHIPDAVVAFLIKLPGDDFLDREHHDHVGWHYHYLDSDERRSNVVLCWDTRATPAAGQPRPLFQEFHGRGFPARPDLWGYNKKQSMHTACAPDLAKRDISEFRCASNEAGPVWPTTATLTPILPPRLSPKQSKKKKSR